MDFAQNFEESKNGKYFTPDQIADFLSAVGPISKFYAARKKGYSVANVSASFDIETSSWYHDGTKMACMYCWSLGINGAVTFGRTGWADVIKIFKQISDHFRLDETRYITFYVHNLGYEFQFFRKWVNVIEMFAMSEREPVFVRTDTGIAFRDSLILTGKSLAKTDEDLSRYKVNKLVGALDYRQIRHRCTPMSAEEIKYSCFDVLVVMADIQERIEAEKKIVNIPQTKTGYVRRRCRNACLYGDTGGSHTADKNETYRKYRGLMDALTMTPMEYKRLKRAFMGGYTHANALYVDETLEDVTSFDIASSYPTVICTEQFPMSTGRIVTVESQEEFNKYISLYCCIFDVEFFDLEPIFYADNYLSESHCLGLKDYVVNNGRIVSAGHLITTITNVDYDIIKRCYKARKMIVRNMTVYRRAYLPKAFVQTTLELYVIKTSYKDLPDKEIEYKQAKSDINALFGMTVMDPVRDEIQYTEDWGTQSANLDEAIEHYNKSKNRFISYAWGVFITAYARHNLWELILETGKNDDHVYADTDSDKIRNADRYTGFISEYNRRIDVKLKMVCDHYKIPYEMTRPKTVKGVEKPLGHFCFDGHYERFKTLGAKRYMVMEEGKINITVSGVNKEKAVPYLWKKYKTADKIFEKFCDHLTIPGEYSADNEILPGSGKLCRTYMDMGISGTVVDYLGNVGPFDERSYIHMEPTSYSMRLIDEFVNYFRGVKEKKDSRYT